MTDYCYANAQLRSERELEALVSTLELIEKKLANTEWLVQVLHCINPGHVIFAKDYIYERPAKARAMNALPLLKNDDGFFDNLPLIPISQ